MEWCSVLFHWVGLNLAVSSTDWLINWLDMCLCGLFFHQINVFVFVALVVGFMQLVYTHYIYRCNNNWMPFLFFLALIKKISQWWFFTWTLFLDRHDEYLGWISQNICKWNLNYLQIACEGKVWYAHTFSLKCSSQVTLVAYYPVLLRQLAFLVTGMWVIGCRWEPARALCGFLHPWD